MKLGRGLENKSYEEKLRELVCLTWRRLKVDLSILQIAEGLSQEDKQGFVLCSLKFIYLFDYFYPTCLLERTQDGWTCTGLTVGGDIPDDSR